MIIQVQTLEFDVPVDNILVFELDENIDELIEVILHLLLAYSHSSVQKFLHSSIWTRFNDNVDVRIIFEYVMELQNILVIEFFMVFYLS